MNTTSKAGSKPANEIAPTSNCAIDAGRAAAGIAVLDTPDRVAPYVRLAERLNALTTGTHAKKTAFFMTGVEAVENAIKVARPHTRRPGVISLAGASHGRSCAGLALTGKVRAARRIGRFLGGGFQLPATEVSVTLLILAIARSVLRDAPGW